MPRFSYTAIDAQGQPLSGEIDGSNLATVRDALQRLGLKVRDLRDALEPGGVLTAADAAAITQQIALATHNSLPLVGSLRAFSEEIISTSLRQRLSRVCDALDAGEPLQKVLSNPRLRLPRSVAAIMDSGLPHEAMNHLLSLSVRAGAMAADLRARAFLLLTYPVLMIAAIGGFWSFLLLYVTPQFGEIFTDFGVQISPFLTQLIQLSRVLQKWYLIYFLAPIPIVLLAIAVCRFGLSANTRQRLWCGLPIIGSMYRLTALSELAKLLAVMLESRVPLPQAVAWSGAGTNDADLRTCCQDVANRLRLGEDIATAARGVQDLPAHLDQMLRFAAHGAAGAEPLRSMAQLLEVRAKTLSQAAMPLLEPVLLTSAVVSVVAYVLTVFPPLIKLLNDLS